MTRSRRPLLRTLTGRRALAIHPPAVPERQPGRDAVGERRGIVVDNAVYVDGWRVGSPRTLAETYATLRERPGSIAWIGLYRPDENMIASLAAEFELHELVVEDTIVAHQRPKLERYDDVLFLVLHAAGYLDETEEVEFGELHVLVGPEFVLTVRHSEAPDLTGVRSRMESNHDLLRLGPEAVLYAILDKVVDDYAPVVAGLENDIDEIETQVFTGDPRVSRRIYELSREVIEFQRATHPLTGILAALEAGFDKYATDEELRRRLQDVADHLIVVTEQVDAFRQLLRDMLAVNATLVSQKQNEEMRLLTVASQAQGEEVKKISSWAAILFAPTVIAGIYGMNFTRLPELGWTAGYPFSLGLMALVCLGLYLAFKRRGWL